MVKKSRKKKKREKLRKQGARRRRKKQVLSPNKLRFVPVNPAILPKKILDKWERYKQAELERKKYGLVRPIISTDFRGKKIVAVGNQIHWSENWKTFIDFLFDYIKTVLGSEWGNKELKKPFSVIHPIMQWYIETCNFQKKQVPDKDGIYGAIPNGSMAAYILLSYDLYVLQHHASIQKEMVQRLKNKDQFQGARYELFVAATCIKAGFDLQYEDEKDRNRTHVEFIGTHKITGQKVCVEAKSRHRRGVLGQPGKIDTENQIKVRMGRLLNDELKKKNNHPLVVFIDLNIPQGQARKVYEKPLSGEFKKIIDYIDKTYGQIDKFNLLVFTNFPHHYGKEDEPALPINIAGILPARAELLVEYPQVILDLYNSANHYGKVPIDFPKQN